MELSVVIPASGKRDLLVRCLTSLNRDIPDFPFDVCVIDDASGLDGPIIEREAAVSYPLIVKSLETPRGRSAARNTGIAATGGRIVVFLDADMEVSPGFLAAHRTAHYSSPHTAVVGTIRWPPGGSFRRYVGSRGIAKLKSRDSVPPWYFVTGNASVERSDLPSEAPFDETLSGWGGEDLDLGMRLRDRGVGFATARDAVAYHHFDGTLREHLSRTFDYGRTVLPGLTIRYPELVRITRLDHLASPFWRFLIGAPLYGSIGTIADLLDPLPLPDAVFDYLTFAAYARGWIRGTRS